MNTPFGWQDLWQVDPNTNSPLKPPEAPGSTVFSTPDAHSGRAIVSFVTDQSARSLAGIVALAQSLRRNGQAGAASELAAACLSSPHVRSDPALQAGFRNLGAYPAKQAVAA